MNDWAPTHLINEDGEQRYVMEFGKFLLTDLQYLELKVKRNSNLIETRILTIGAKGQLCYERSDGRNIFVSSFSGTIIELNNENAAPISENESPRERRDWLATHILKVTKGHTVEKTYLMKESSYFYTKDEWDHSAKPEYTYCPIKGMIWPNCDLFYYEVEEIKRESSAIKGDLSVLISYTDGKINEFEITQDSFEKIKSSITKATAAIVIFMIPAIKNGRHFTAIINMQKVNDIEIQ